MSSHKLKIVEQATTDTQLSLLLFSFFILPSLLLNSRTELSLSSNASREVHSVAFLFPIVSHFSPFCHAWRRRSGREYSSFYENGLEASLLDFDLRCSCRLWLLFVGGIHLAHYGVKVCLNSDDYCEYPIL